MLNFLLNILNSFKQFINNLNKFNKTILFSALIILIIVLIVVGIMLKKALFNTNYPPVISDCPDYWDVSLNNNNQVTCKNIVKRNSGTCKNDSYPVEQFYEYASNKSDVICAKYKWAKKCDISWDGITNNSEACQ